MPNFPKVPAAALPFTRPFSAAFQKTSRTVGVWVQEPGNLGQLNAALGASRSA